MEQENLADLKEKLEDIQSKVELIRETWGEFPAIHRNASRVLASLTMMHMALGVPSVPPLELD